MAGGSHYHLSKRIRRLGISTDHFTGQAHNKGQISSARKSAEEVLIQLAEGSPRPRTPLLKRALLESKVEEKCAICGLTEWLGTPITLDIDHVDGDWLNNLLTNLRFLCPNCHRQTATFGSKVRPTVLPERFELSLFRA